MIQAKGVGVDQHLYSADHRGDDHHVNGEQGIELAESLDPDLILLDLNMPGMNGLETLDKLREKSLSGRIVVFSVSNHEEDVVTALKRGAEFYDQEVVVDKDQLVTSRTPDDLPAFNREALRQLGAGRHFNDGYRHKAVRRTTTGRKHLHGDTRSHLLRATDKIAGWCPCVITAIWLAKGHTSEAKSGNAKVGFS